MRVEFTYGVVLGLLGTMELSMIVFLSMWARV